jgi:hypothetical protein
MWQKMKFERASPKSICDLGEGKLLLFHVFLFLLLLPVLILVFLFLVCHMRLLSVGSAVKYFHAFARMQAGAKTPIELQGTRIISPGSMILSQ